MNHKQITHIHFKVILLIMIFLSISTIYAQTQQRMWNGKQYAVTLTYDDGLDVHLDNVVPVLDTLNFKATFYVPGKSESLKNRLEDWKNLAKKHEIGNHTLFHPCRSKSGKRAWVVPEYDLDKYTLSQMLNELSVANTLLSAIDGKTERTFAYTCGDTTVSDSCFVNNIKEDFLAARGTHKGLNHIKDLDLYNIKVYTVNGQTAEKLLDIVNQAKEEMAWVVFLFHGVGGGHSYNISLEAHNKLLNHLKKNKDEVWVASFIDVVKLLKENKNTN